MLRFAEITEMFEDVKLSKIRPINPTSSLSQKSLELCLWISHCDCFWNIC